MCQSPGFWDAWFGLRSDSIPADRDEKPDEEDHMTVTLPLPEALENETELFFHIEERSRTGKNMPGGTNGMPFMSGKFLPMGSAE